MTEQLDRKDLKIKALLQKVSQLVSNYENQVADLRVELTVMEQEWTKRFESQRQQIQYLEESAEAEPPRFEVVKGDVEGNVEEE